MLGKLINKSGKVVKKELVTDESSEISTSTLLISENGEFNYLSTPVTVAFEADATSWLTLRGSVSQSVHGSVPDFCVEAGIDTGFYRKRTFAEFWG